MKQAGSTQSLFRDLCSGGSNKLAKRTQTHLSLAPCPRPSGRIFLKDFLKNTLKNLLLNLLQNLLNHLGNPQTSNTSNTTPRLEPRPDYNVLSFSLRLAPRGSLTPGMIPFKSLKAQTGWVPLPQWTRSPMPVFYRSNAIGCLSGTFH